MGKFRPGIPDGFALDVVPVADLGDYLDETAPAAPNHERAGVRGGRPARAIGESPPPAVTTARPDPGRPDARASDPGDPDVRTDRRKAPRREITMTPEALRMSDDLLALVRSGSGQRDTTASELFHALVLLAYEARAGLDPHALPKRGQWGTPTARAYPRALTAALLAALLRVHRPDASGTGGIGPRATPS
ncbi:MAG: hypothetical protein U0871_01235 [Gemmataceae bacterium]